MYKNKLGEEFIIPKPEIIHWGTYWFEEKKIEYSFMDLLELDVPKDYTANKSEERYVTEICKNKAGAMILMAEFLEKNKLTDERINKGSDGGVL